VALRLEPMLFDALNTHRLERAVADVERDLDDDDPARGERSRQRGADVKPRRGRSNGPALPREDGLIPIAIAGPIGPLDVRRQRNMPYRVDRVVDRRSIGR